MTGCCSGSTAATRRPSRCSPGATARSSEPAARAPATTTSSRVRGPPTTRSRRRSAPPSRLRTRAGADRTGRAQPRGRRLAGGLRDLRARGLLPARETAALTVVNDALGALRGGTSDGVGVAIVCGTGTAVGARASDGRSWNVSFWAEPSYRYSLARGAVEATIEAELGIGEPTLLQQLVPASTGGRSRRGRAAAAASARRGRARRRWRRLDRTSRRGCSGRTARPRSWCSRCARPPPARRPPCPCRTRSRRRLHRPFRRAGAPIASFTTVIGAVVPSRDVTSRAYVSQSSGQSAPARLSTARSICGGRRLRPRARR